MYKEDPMAFSRPHPLFAMQDIGLLFATDLLTAMRPPLPATPFDAAVGDELSDIQQAIIATDGNINMDELITTAERNMANKFPDLNIE